MMIMAPTPHAESYALPPMDRLVDLMMDAARGGRDDVIPALLQAGVDINARDAAGYTALILASYNGRLETTELLLSKGAAVACADTARGNTALMGVAFKGYAEIAALLLDKGADPDQRNASGQTALMLAALFGHGSIIDMLLSAGADPHAVDAAGNTAASVAASQGNQPVVDTVHAAGGVGLRRT